MKLEKMIIVTLSLLAITLSGCTNEPDTRIFSSKDTQECSKIAFTCPQGYEQFSNAEGCGCQTSTKQDDPEERRLDNLVRKHLSTIIMEPGHQDGFITAEFNNISTTEDENGTLTYESYVIVREYYTENNMLLIGETQHVLVSMKIEQPGRHYIIRDYNIVEQSQGVFIEEEVNTQFSQELYDWVFNKDENERNDILKTMQGYMDFEGQTHFGMILGNFENIAPSSETEETEQPKAE